MIYQDTVHTRCSKCLPPESRHLWQRSLMDYVDCDTTSNVLGRLSNVPLPSEIPWWSIVLLNWSWIHWGALGFPTSKNLKIEFGRTRALYLKNYVLVVKVKVLPIQAAKVLRVGRDIALPNLKPRHWRGGGGSAPGPGRFTPGKDPIPIYRKLGGPQGRSVRKISPPPGFDLRTVQPVASRYTDWAIPAATYWLEHININFLICFAKDNSLPRLSKYFRYNLHICIHVWK